MEIFCSVGYTAAIVWMSKKAESLSRLRISGLLRQGALVLLATQNYIIGMCRIVFAKLSGDQDFMASHIVLKPVVLLVVYAISIPLIWLIVNRMPFVLAKSKALSFAKY